MPLTRKCVDSLGKYMEQIASIAQQYSVNTMYPPILWFRGQSNASYSLIPSLFRTKAHAEKKAGIGNYTKLHYAEDIRTQHYIAKNFHLLSKEPSSRVEWLEVMQHHQVNTRVLDWSESSLHSLLFALEPFFDGSKYKEDSRKKCVPCVWVLSPKMLNKKIMKHLQQDTDLQKSLMNDLGVNTKEQKAILHNFKEYGEFGVYSETEETNHIDYIFNLSSINDELLRDRNRLKELLIKGDVMNPYYYLLSRIYSDGYVLKDRKLPPLCVVHPYHSERIKAQKGVFSVFPFYEEQPQDLNLRKNNINPDAMEFNNMAADCLCQILIKNPQKVALEMLDNGLNDSWLYPEMPVVSSEIENHRIL